MTAFATAYFILHPFVLPERQSLRAAAAAAVLTALGLMTPWPDRALVQVLHDNGVRELRSYRRIPGELRARNKEKSYERKAFKRFAGALDFAADAAQPPELADKGWSRGQAAGERAWLDGKSGLVWSPGLEPRFPEYSDEYWKTALLACVRREPEGWWALPSMAEFIQARNHGILEAVDDIRGVPRWYAAAYLPDMSVVLMAAYAAGPATNAAGSGVTGVRCVGRTRAAPAEGYLEAENKEVLEAMK